MKITLNLSPAESLRDRLALAWAIPAILLGGGTNPPGPRLAPGISRLSRSPEPASESSDALCGSSEPGSGDSQEAGRPGISPVAASGQICQQDHRRKGAFPHAIEFAGGRPVARGRTTDGPDAHLPKKTGDDYAVRMGMTPKAKMPSRRSSTTLKIPSTSKMCPS